jgi:hypothetical protein
MTSLLAFFFLQGASGPLAALWLFRRTARADAAERASAGGRERRSGGVA